nr:Protein of unknown function DUF362 [uncultured bacterium]
MSAHAHFDRRHFLKASILGGAAALAGNVGFPTAQAAEAAPAAAQILASRVALTAGNDRADLAFKGLQPFAKQIAAAIGDKRVIIKPNNVAIDKQLSATHAENIEGILEFLKSIGKSGNVIIAESAASGPSLEGFANYGYNPLAAKYGARLMDLDQEGVEIMHCFDENDFRPHPCRMSRILLDPNNFIISAAKFKTHDRIVATLSLKNIVVGAPVKDPGFTWGKGRKPGTTCDKALTHGGGFRGINYNLYALAARLHPHLAVIDGYEGMEGEGPVGGTPVDHKVCVVSPDWLAADRIAVELMGIDFAKIGYLNFCAESGMGVADLSKIEIVGPALKDHIKPYKLAKNIDKQLVWQQPVKQG